MGTVSGFAGWAGIVLFVFGLLSFVLTGRFDAWTAVHVAGGGVLAAVAAASNLASFRRALSARATRERAGALAGAALFVTILVAMNVLAARYPLRWDLTERRIHTLSEKSRAVARGVVEPVDLVAFWPSGDPDRERVVSLLGRFAEAGEGIRVRIVDPEREPGIAEREGVTSTKTLVARAGEERARIAEGDGKPIDEGAIASLLRTVTRRGPRAVLFVTGHGEGSASDLDSPDGLGALARTLESESLVPRPLLLATAPEVPDDAAVVVVAGPRKELLSHEIGALERYLERGGGVLVLLDPGPDAGLAPLLARCGIALADDLVIDREEMPFLGARLGLDPIVSDFPPHPATRGFRERIVLFQARSVDRVSDTAPEAGRAAVVARSGSGSWAEREWREALATGRVGRGEEERAGPIPVAVAAAGPGGRGRLLVIGDADLARNGNLGTFFNREFLVQAVLWTAGEEDWIAELPRTLRASRLDMSEADYRTMLRFGVLLLPEGLLVLGLAVWWRRRAL